jgi:hypothetical protein
MLRRKKSPKLANFLGTNYSRFLGQSLISGTFMDESARAALRLDAGNLLIIKG